VPVPDRDDRELAERVARLGDDRAFSELYDRHTPYLYGLALRLGGGDEALAAEMVHDAWVLATGRLAEFRWQSALRTWLAGFVVTRFREHWRQAPEPTLDSGAEVRTDDRLLATTWERVDLERAIAALPPGYREVLVLHDIEGYTHVEIGDLLGLDAGTSKSQLSRARSALRLRLATHDRKGAARDG
jgi:RNA polymerase sigma-70 factor (ECF subfamily)